MKETSKDSSTEEATLIGESLKRGESMVSTNDRVSLGKYQNIIITEKPQPSMSNLTPEEKILRDYIEREEVIWHTYKKAVPLEEMDTDFKVLAALHSLKIANKLNDQINEHDDAWKQEMTQKMNAFMYIFEEFEDNLMEQEGIELPNTIEEIKELRETIETPENITQ